MLVCVHLGCSLGCRIRNLTHWLSTWPQFDNTSQLALCVDVSIQALVAVFHVGMCISCVMLSVMPASPNDNDHLTGLWGLHGGCELFGLAAAVQPWHMSAALVL